MEAYNAFVDFKTRAETFQEKKLKAYQTDNGTEFVNLDFRRFLSECGIMHRLSMAGAHQQMGVSERLNLTLLTMARCMIIQSGLPDYFWGEAINTACFIKNRCKSRSIDNQIPYELWYKTELSDKELKQMRVFGCQAWVTVENVKSQKMRPRAIECVMLGYPKDKRGYRLWDLKQKCVVLSRDVNFNESVFPMLKSNDGKNIRVKSAIQEVAIDDFCNENFQNDDENERENEENHDDDQSVHGSEYEDENEVEITAPPVLRRSSRVKNRKECFCCKSVKLSSCNFCDPQTVNEALSSEDKNEWIKAMEEEMRNMKKNQTWELVIHPEQCKITGSKWVFKTKRNQDGKVVRYKARLVAQGYDQILGVDYNETYSPVVSRKVIRIMTALLVENNWDCHHVDVKCAYLNSDIKETIFIKQPEGFVSKDSPDHVCKLRKSMYGLKQAGKDWYDHLDRILKNLGLERSVSDCCLYLHSSGQLFVTVYVDDLEVLGPRDMIKIFVNLLEQKLDIRDLGFPTNLLNVKFVRDKNAVYVNQSQYIDFVLREYGMEECKGVTTTLPMAMKDVTKPKFEEEQPCNVTEFRSIVGSLRYVAGISRPDISYSVCKLSQKFEFPTAKDLKDAMHLLRYLKHTKDLSLRYSKTDECCIVYVDASWGDPEAKGKSITGYVIMLGGSAVIWKSVKQKRVAADNNEAEVIAMVDVLKEVRWLEVFLKDVKMSKFLSKPCVIFGDNQGGILISKGEKVSDRTRHCIVESHLLQESVKTNFVEFVYVPTKNNVADLLTKTLSGVSTSNFSLQLGLV